MLRLLRQVIQHIQLHAAREEVLEAQALIQARLAHKHDLASKREIDLIWAAVIASAMT